MSNHNKQPFSPRNKNNQEHLKVIPKEGSIKSYPINQQIELLHAKIERLNLHAISIDSQLSLRKQQLAKPQQSQSIKHIQDLLSSIERKIQLIISQTSSSVKRLKNELSQKLINTTEIKQKQNNIITNITNNYQQIAKQLKQHYQSQLNQIIKQYSQRQSTILNRLTLIDNKYNNLLQEFINRQKNYLKRIFQLEQEIHQHKTLRKKMENDQIKLKLQKDRLSQTNKKYDSLSYKSKGQQITQISEQVKERAKQNQIKSNSFAFENPNQDITLTFYQPNSFTIQPSSLNHSEIKSNKSKEQYEMITSRLQQSKQSIKSNESSIVKRMAQWQNFEDDQDSDNQIGIILEEPQQLYNPQI